MGGQVRVYPSFFGLGFYWAWLWLFFFTTNLIPAGAVGFAEVNLMRALALAVEGLVFLAFVLNMVRRDPLVFGRGVDNAVICVCGALGTVGIIVFGLLDFRGGSVLYASSWVLWGVSGAFLTVLWGRILDSLSAASICLYLAGSAVLGAAVVYVLVYMPLGFTCLAALALPLVSVLFAHHAKNVIRGDDFEGKIPPAPVTDPVIVPRPLMRILSGVFAYSLALGLMLAMVMGWGSGGFDLSGKFALAAPAAVGLVLALCSYAGKDAEALPALYRFAMPMAVVGLLLLSRFGGWGAVVAVFLVVAGFQCFDTVVMVVLFQGSRHFEHLSIRSFVMGRLANVSGLSVGWGLGSLAVCGALPALADQSLLCLAAASLIVLFSSVALLEEDLFPGRKTVAEAKAAKDAREETPFAIDMDAAIAAISEEGGLSAQEKRVFAYLAKGHSRKTIQQKLFIASATVDTHARHVYRKLGVKTRQELIDLVGSRLESSDR